MSDSDEESSQSLQHERMSVSDLDEEGVSREEGDMPSAELSAKAARENNSHEDPSSTSASSSEDFPGVSAARGTDHPPKVSQQHQFDTVELDDAAMELMSGSYSEILRSPSSHFKDVKEKPTEEIEVNDEPKLTSLEGTVVQEGGMVHFIAKNLETKIKLSPSPDISSSADSFQANCMQSCTTEPNSGTLVSDSSFLISMLEREAQCISTSIDSLTEHLAASLHTISAVTAQSLSVYKDSVCKTCDAMDANIKSMYQLMAKCEELSKSMAPIYKQAEQVKEIKKLLDILENLA